MNSRTLFAWTIAALIAGGVMAAVAGNTAAMPLVTQAVIYSIFALGVGVLLKQNGLVSFGHALYFGAAHYGVGILLQWQIMPAELAVLATLVGVTVAAFLIGLVIVRVPGIAFGMLTLAIGQMFYLIASRSRGLTGGADGMNIDWPTTLFGFTQTQLLAPVNLFLICWCALVLVMALLTLLLRGRFGAITEAVRDNEERARFIGISTLLPRAAVYALSAAVTAVAGVLSSLNTGFVSPESLHWSLSGMALMMVVIGGSRQLWGAVIGALVYFVFKGVLGEHATHWMSIFGMALIVVIVFAPTGIAGALLRVVRVRLLQQQGAQA
ncbi:branched-chain amino acid ABC transporter permease [Diaphorobacter sp. HDW4B]|uniref:branched-chain amino acid ABC transporter permease n=1 Tax=Diaphorobacter sp. HDW4B TaxID=2714925 RepID=UPI0014092097|nr:branched-chain amino acid ABC transporter permease [Diaphorobacter sp. HDW4B]QIL69303.1 branched-chain amino acid ABC transporter permease [Diaphorobacter sp. HDW4B]